MPLFKILAEMKIIMRRKIAILILSILIVLLPLPSAYSQLPSTSSFPQYDTLNPETIIYWRDGSLWELNPITGQETFYLDYQPPTEWHFQQMVLDANAGYLYVNEAEGIYQGYMRPQWGRFLRINLSTGEHEVLWEGLELEFMLSPNKVYALIITSEPWKEDNTIYNQPEKIKCVLALSQGQCNEINLNGQIIWLDDETLVAIDQGQQTLTLLNWIPSERTQTSLVDLVHSMDMHQPQLIPDTSLLILGNLFLLDLSQLDAAAQLTEIPYLIDYFLISPDGRKIFFEYRAQYIPHYEVLDLKTRERIAIETSFFTESWDDFLGVIWLPNSQGIVAIVQQGDIDVQIDNIIYIDIFSGHIDFIESYEMIFPDSLYLVEY